MASPQALSQREALLRGLRAAPLPTLFTSLPEQVVLAANEPFESTSDWKEAELAGRAIARLRMWEDPAAAQELCARVASGDPVQAQSVVLRRPAGDTWTALLSVRTLELGGEKLAIWQAANVSALARELEELREADFRHTHLSRLTADYTYAARVGPLGVEQQWMNESFGEVTGYSPEEFSSLTYRMLVHPDDLPAADARVRKIFEQAGNAYSEHELKLLTKRGEVRWVRERLQTVPRGDALYFFGAGHDITAPHRAERLLAAERARTVSEIASQVAHAINNPLQALMGTLQLRVTSAVEVDPLDRRLEETAGRIARVVEGILSLSRGAQLAVADVRIEEILERVRSDLEPRSRGHGVELRIAVEPGTPALRADREMLTAAITAVAENAIDASPHGSPVRVDARFSKNRGVQIRVTDDGPGIPAEVQARVFEPFFSTKRRGTGLGLAIASSIVRGHGGRVRIESAEGEGTTVRIELPVPSPR